MNTFIDQADPAGVPVDSAATSADGLPEPRRKRVLVVYYSNGGTVETTLRLVANPIAARPDVIVTWLQLTPMPAYGFPWTPWRLFDTAPETISDQRVELASTALRGPFDLVLLGWQVWWLRPSAPVSAFLDASGAALLEGARVVLVGCARQMWRAAQARLLARVRAVGGRSVESIMVRYEGAGATLITTPMMLLTGRRSWPAPLPQAVLRPAEVAAAARCGERLAAHRDWDSHDGPILGDLAPGSYDPAYAVPEAVASGYMSFWRPIFSQLGGRGTLSRPILVTLWAAGFLVGVMTVVPGWLVVRMIFRAIGAAAGRTRRSPELAGRRRPHGAKTAP